METFRLRSGSSILRLTVKSGLEIAGLRQYATAVHASARQSRADLAVKVNSVSYHVSARNLDVCYIPNKTPGDDIISFFSFTSLSPLRSGR